DDPDIDAVHRLVLQLDEFRLALLAGAPDRVFRSKQPDFRTHPERPRPIFRKRCHVFLGQAAPRSIRLERVAAERAQSFSRAYPERAAPVFEHSGDVVVRQAIFLRITDEMTTT